MLIFGEIAYIFRRRGNRPQMMRMGFISIFLFILIVLFFALRWDTTLYPQIVELLKAS